MLGIEDSILFEEVMAYSLDGSLINTHLGGHDNNDVTFVVPHAGNFAIGFEVNGVWDSGFVQSKMRARHGVWRRSDSSQREFI